MIKYKYISGRRRGLYIDFIRSEKDDTYPTMMNAIDLVKNDDGQRLFTNGHFGLIIIDESHRSIGC